MTEETMSTKEPVCGGEVNATVGQRGRVVDASWAPWLRAQAKAIAHVAMLVEPNEAKRDAYLAREMGFADTLETRGA
jgi:hypothetical protein